jgi:antitoxin component YwqK of YwqJK toxin-antitoxin module
MKKYAHIIASTFSKKASEIEIEYLDEEMLSTTKEDAVFYKVYKQDSLDVSIYRMDNILQMSCLLKVSSQEWLFTEYYPNQQIKSKGFYKHGAESYTLQTWHENEQPEFEMTVFPKKGEPIQEEFMYAKVANFWDSTGHQYIKDGIGELTLYYENKKKKYQENMKMDLPQGNG